MNPDWDGSPLPDLGWPLRGLIAWGLRKIDEACEAWADDEPAEVAS